MKNLLFKRIGDIILAVYSDQPPSDEEWNAYVAALVAAYKATSGTKGVVRSLVVTDGGGPNAIQRKRCFEAVEQFQNWTKSPAAVISASAVARGIVTVLSWFNIGIKVFSPNQTEEAFTFLGFSKQECSLVRTEIQRCKLELESSRRKG